MVKFLSIQHFKVLHQASSLRMFNYLVSQFHAAHCTPEGCPDEAVRQVNCDLYHSWLREASRFRNFFAGAAGTGSLLDMNNCGLENGNKDAKKVVDRNSPFDRVLIKLGGHLRDKSLKMDPSDPNFEAFQVTPTITPSNWVDANYIFVESKRTEERFIHILRAYPEDTLPASCVHVCDNFVFVRVPSNSIRTCPIAYVHILPCLSLKPICSPARF